MFGFEDDIFLICVYIRPQNSSRNKINTSTDPFDKITDKIAELSSQGQVVLMGDLNSRTGHLNDFLFEDNDANGDIFSDPDQNERRIVNEDLLNNNMSLLRSNEDKVVNENGRILIRLALMSSLLILNGRFGNDKGIGRNTYCENRNNKIFSSTVDYVLCSRNLLYSISCFDVKDFNSFSDHAAIDFEIKCHVKRNTEKSNMSVNFTKVKWREEKRKNFVLF